MRLDFRTNQRKLVIAFLQLQHEYETFLLVPCLLIIREHFFKLWSLLARISVVFCGEIVLLSLQVAELCCHESPRHDGNQRTWLCRLDMSAQISTHSVPPSCKMKTIDVAARLLTASACLSKPLRQICLSPSISLLLSALWSTPLYELIKPSYTAVTEGWITHRTGLEMAFGRDLPLQVPK